MQTLIVKTESVAEAKFLSSFLKTVTLVKSVFIEPTPNQSGRNMKLEESSESYDWTNPTRTATDDEFEKMISEAEKEKDIPLKVAKEQTMKELNRWIASQKK